MKVFSAYGRADKKVPSVSDKKSCLVTVAIPTRNRASYLRLAVDSVLSQTHTNLQVLISDNCSTDSTATYLESLQDPRIVVLHQPRNIGMIGNWNACLDAATGEYFILLSDDDLLEKEAIGLLVAAIEEPQSGEAGIAYGRCWVVDDRGAPLSLDAVVPETESASDFALRFFLKEREIRPCATLLRTADIRAVGGYTQGVVELAVDAIVWSKVVQLRRTVNSVLEPVARYRVHSSNLSSVQSISVWQSDLTALAELWIADCHDMSRSSRRKLVKATRRHQAWMIAVLINQSAQSSYLNRFRLLRVYFDCRSSFLGLGGAANLLLGLFKLFTPHAIKRPVRSWAIKRLLRSSISRQ